MKNAPKGAFFLSVRGHYKGRDAWLAVKERAVA